jgi:serine/threonine-protein kinase PknK
MTKFRPPTTTRQLVRRDRLLAVLRAGAERRLILVHAPAGFGKSSLLTQWRDELVAAGIAMAWLTVDRDDDNAVWFLSHLVEAIRRVRPDVVGDLGQALEEQGQAVERFVLTSLINRVHDSGDPLVVVIDDWHQVTAAEPIAAMEFLLDNGCHHLRMVVSTRSWSNLPLSRLRVRGELCEIGPQDLSFDFPESRRFFGDPGPITLSDSEVEDLQASTDGWVAALQLASLSLRDAGDAASLLEQFREGDATLAEYLAENFLDSLEPDLLGFVLATAVPDRVCGDLASTLADVPDGAARLEQVVARDLFLERTRRRPPLVPLSQSVRTGAQATCSNAINPAGSHSCITQRPHGSRNAACSVKPSTTFSPPVTGKERWRCSSMTTCTCSIGRRCRHCSV